MTTLLCTLARSRLTLTARPPPLRALDREVRGLETAATRPRATGWRSTFLHGRSLLSLASWALTFEAASLEESISPRCATVVPWKREVCLRGGDRKLLHTITELAYVYRLVWILSGL